jgi:hypothetical protein
VPPGLVCDVRAESIRSPTVPPTRIAAAGRATTVVAQRGRLTRPNLRLSAAFASCSARTRCFSRTCSTSRVADHQHDVGAASDELASRFEADAAVGAGHDEGASGLPAQLPCLPGHAGSVRPTERASRPSNQQSPAPRQRPTMSPARRHSAATTRRPAWEMLRRDPPRRRAGRISGVLTGDGHPNRLGPWTPRQSSRNSRCHRWWLAAEEADRPCAPGRLSGRVVAPGRAPQRQRPAVE